MIKMGCWKDSQGCWRFNVPLGDKREMSVFREELVRLISERKPVEITNTTEVKKRGGIPAFWAETELDIEEAKQLAEQALESAQRRIKGWKEKK